MGAARTNQQATAAGQGWCCCCSPDVCMPCYAAALGHHDSAVAGADHHVLQPLLGPLGDVTLLKRARLQQRVTHMPARVVHVGFLSVNPSHTSRSRHCVTAATITPLPPAVCWHSPCSRWMLRRAARLYWPPPAALLLLHPQRFSAGSSTHTQRRRQPALSCCRLLMPTGHRGSGAGSQCCCVGTCGHAAHQGLHICVCGLAGVGPVAVADVPLAAGSTAEAAGGAQVRQVLTTAMLWCASVW